MIWDVVYANRGETVMAHNLLFVWDQFIVSSLFMKVETKKIGLFKF